MLKRQAGARTKDSNEQVLIRSGEDRWRRVECCVAAGRSDVCVRCQNAARRGRLSSMVAVRTARPRQTLHAPRGLELNLSNLYTCTARVTVKERCHRTAPRSGPVSAVGAV